MAFEEALHGMYDPRLKPRLLSSVMATYLPDDRQPPRPPAELSFAVSTIRRHHLLFEPATNESSAARLPGKTVDVYKAAVDAWTERLTVLIASTATEKCWAGVCLLGVTCQECTRQRFLESYSSWFQKLLVHLKPADPLFLRGAACASLTDLLMRLGTLIEFTGVRREGTSLNAKLAQPLLQLLGEEGSKSIWNDAIDLLCMILKYFPASLKQQSSQVEAMLVAKLMEADIDASLSQRFARCLSLLPKTHGDAATWNSLFRRILLAINTHLDDAFAGMEDVNTAKDAVSALMLRGQEQSSFLGGVSVVASAMTEGAKKFWQLLVPRISVLLQCCHFLLVNTYPVQVPVPLSALLALVRRILSVDGSPYRSASVVGVPLSSAQQTYLCCELPALHSCALDLLYATLCGVRSQLLPRAADMVRLLTEYFQHCGSPSLRIKLYIISKHLLISMGVGMASELAPAIIDNSLSDLKGVANVCSPYTSNTSQPVAAAWTHGVSGWSQLLNPRKRKHAGNMQMDMPPATGVVDVGVHISGTPSPIDVQIASLEAIEALLTVGGSLNSDRWRTEVDSVVANVALTASSGALSPSLIFEEDNFSKEGSLTFTSGSFRLAAYKALLASLLSPCTHRPPFLSQGLAVFRKGRQEAAGTEVAEFCAHALLALEPLIHPRSLPFASTTAATTAGITPVRVSASETLVSPLQRPGLPLQAVPGSISAATVSHGYPPQLAPPTLKVSRAGMQLDVEGDPYVQEDIESWIIDYGGDQNALNETNAMIVEGINGGFQSIDDNPNALTKAVANVSARQSLAHDEDGVMVSMVGDMLIESREVSRAVPSETMPTVNFEMNDANEAPNLYATQVGKTGISLKEMDELPQSAECPPDPTGIPEYTTSVEQGHNTDSQKRFSLSVPVKDTGDNNVSGRSSQNEIAKQQEDFVPGLAALVFPDAEARNLSESDSDVIPDIVDGDPDTD